MRGASLEWLLATQGSASGFLESERVGEPGDNASGMFLLSRLVVRFSSKRTD